MKFRTGSLILWKSTREWDVISDYTLGLGGLHISLVLVGKSFEQFSKCGPSPTDTYVTFQITSIYPIEEIVGQLWTKPNSSAMYILHRKNKHPNICEQFALESYVEYISMEKVSVARRTRLAVLAYFRLGFLEEDPVKNKINYNLCPWFVGWMLFRFGILSKEVDLNTLLPFDYLKLKFGQRHEYYKIEVFDKGTMELGKGIYGLLENLGLIEFESHENELIDEIIGNYEFPKYHGNLR